MPMAIVFFNTDLIAQEEQEIEEVIVTSTKKAESIQNLALSVQALSSKDMEEAQITETEDMAELVPGVVQTPGIGAGTAIGLRGIVGAAVGANTTYSVQNHLNGMQVNGSVFTTIGFLDIQQLEVLAGPQGTLFGRNSVGGVINATSAKPAHNSEGSLKFEFGENGQQRINYAQNFSLTDNLAARIALQSYEQDGLIENLHTGNMVDNRDTEDYRISLSYSLNDTTDIDFVHQKHEQEDHRVHFATNFCERDVFYGCLPWSQGAPNAAAYTSGTVSGLFGIIAQTSNTGVDEYANTVMPSNIDQINRDFDPYVKQDFEITQLFITKQFDNHEIKLKYSDAERDYFRTADVDKSVASIGFTSGVRDTIINGGQYASLAADATFAATVGALVTSGALASTFDATAPTSAEMETIINAYAANGAPVAWNENTPFIIPTLDFICIEPRQFNGATSFECSDVNETTEQFELNIVSDFDGPLNYVLGAYKWTSDNHNTFYTQTVEYSILRSFDLHPNAQFFDGTTLPLLYGQGYGGTAFYQSLLSEAQDGFAGSYDIDNPFYNAAAVGTAACTNPATAITCSEYLAEDLNFVQWMDFVDTNVAPGTFKRILPRELGGLIQDNPVIQETESLYANIFYDITDDTRLTVGYRYNEDYYDDFSVNMLGDATNEDYVYSGSEWDLYNFAGSLEASNAAARTVGSDTAETYKIALQHNITDDIMVYGSFSTGNKPGGSTPDQYGNPSVFEPETVDSIELGLRSILMDGKMLLNATLFDMSFENSHWSQVVGSAAITNTLDFNHRGFEAQMRYFVTPDTSIDVNMLALDSKIADGETLFNPLNPNNASAILDTYFMGNDADYARWTAALNAMFPNGSQALLLPQPADGTLPCAAATAAGLNTLGLCNDALAASGNSYIAGTGTSYATLLAGNEDAQGLLPFLMVALTDTGFVASFQGRNLSAGRWVNDSDSFAALPMPWLAPDYFHDLGGIRTPGTSELDYNVSLNHTIGFGAGNLDLKLTFTHKGDSNSDLFESLLTHVDDQQYIDFFANFTPNSGDYYVGLYVKNVDDDRQIASARTTSEMVGGPANAYYTQPRTSGIRFGVNF